jgi:antitoxin MazE
MKARIVRIGNSRGVRIPKALLDESGLAGEVEITVEGRRLVIAPVARAREGWDEAFAAMANRGDDRLLDDEVATSWDQTEWEW